MVVGISCDHASETSSTALPAESEKRIAVTDVVASQINRDTELAASIESEYTIEIFPRIEGYIRKVYVDIGDRVKEDQSLILLRAPELSDRVRHREELVKEAGAEIQQREAGVGLAQADVRAREAALKIQKIKRDRMAALVKKGSLNQQRLDEAAFGVSSAQADLQHAHAGVDAARADLFAAKAKKEVAKAALDAAKTMAQYRNIRAPFDGLISGRYCDPGDFVEPNTPDSGKGLLELMRLSRVRAIIHLPLEDAAYVNVGDPVILRHESYIGKDRIDSLGGQPLTISRAAQAFNQGSRMMRAEIDIDNNILKRETGELLKPGDYGKVLLTLESLKGKPMVPRSAITTDDKGQQYVVVLDRDNTTKKVVIDKILLEDDGQAVIDASGLKIGQRIVASDPDRVPLGQKIDPSRIEDLFGME
jgi:RND family efflux transporter MFP subunit